MTQLYDCRDSFEDTLRELAGQDSRIVAVVNDSVGSSKLTQFGKEYPTRLLLSSPGARSNRSRPMLLTQMQM